MPNGFPLGRQSRCRLAPSNPLKTKLDGWGGRHWLGWRNGSGQHRGPPATPKARHSRQRRRWARMRNSRTPAGFMPNRLPLGRQSRCRLAHSNPLKTKLDSKGTSQPPASPMSTHAKQQNPMQDSCPTGCHLVGRAPFGTFEPAKNTAGWVGWQALVGLT